MRVSFLEDGWANMKVLIGNDVDVRVNMKVLIGNDVDVSVIVMVDMDKMVLDGIVDVRSLW